MMVQWMIYGANGYTGTLLAEEAVRRGHRPVLAGRSASKLSHIAERLGLDYVVFDLDDRDRLRTALSQVTLVLHAAGPFSTTSTPMLKACLATGTHYCDITGEINVFQQTFAHDTAARTSDVMLISGIGFDVVPTDCLARYVADQVEEPCTLELAIAGTSSASPGTTKTILEGASGGSLVRRDGKLERRPLGQASRQVRFIDRTRMVIPIPWGDLETAYHSTGIPNITTYMALSQPAVTLLRTVAPLAKRITGAYPVRRILQRLVERFVHGPDEHLRQTGRSYMWVRAANQQRKAAEAWLETGEAYRFTADAGIRCVEQVLTRPSAGAHTPSQAFAADFVLTIPGTRRIDRLD